MKDIARYKGIRLLGAVGVAAAVVLASLAFDAHNMALLAFAVLLAFASMTGVAHASRQLGGADMVMSDDWRPSNRYNPYTGLPMLDGAIDVQGNLYGTRSSEAHRRGG